MIKSNQPSVEFRGLLARKDVQQEPSSRASKLSTGLVPVVLTAQVTQEVIAHYLSLMNIEDKRQLGKVKFSAESLIFAMSLAYLCGYRSACSMGKFWETHKKFLQTVIPHFPEGKASHDTIRRAVENVVFERFVQFFTRFTESLLYESFNELHLYDKLPNGQRWLFNLILKEHFDLERQDQQEPERALYALNTEERLRRPYQVVVYSCSARHFGQSVDEIKMQKESLSILALLRNYEFQGAAKNVCFSLER